MIVFTFFRCICMHEVHKCTYVAWGVLFLQTEVAAGPTYETLAVWWLTVWTGCREILLRQIGIGTGKLRDPYSKTLPYSSMNNNSGETLRVKPHTQASAILSCEMPVDRSVVSFQVSSVGVGDGKIYGNRYKITSGFPFIAFCSRKQVTRWPYEDVSNWSLAGEPNQKNFID